MTHDLVVLGGGPAGMSAARAALRRRARVALVQDGPVGGDCTFAGCVPSKTLIESAAQGLDFAAALARVRATVADVATGETADVLSAEGIDVVEGRGRLLGSGRVDVGGRVLRAPHLVVATGAGPVVPSLPGLEPASVLTNETVFDLRERPASLLVLGGGPVGVELAQAFARLGVAVTLVETAPRLLGREEPDAAGIVAAALAAGGVDIRCGRRVVAARRGPGGTAATLDDGTVVTATRVLAAVGRRPATDRLGLDAAGVATDGSGHVIVDDRLRTGRAGIYAAGDVTGRVPLTHAADEMGRVAAGNALGRVPWRRFRAGWVPSVVFTTPEVARVGMSESEAAAHGGRVAYLPLAEVDRARAARRTGGYVKLVAGPRRVGRDLAGGRLLGATIVADRAGEMIALATLAVRTGMYPARLALTTQAYPTWSIALQQAAAQYFFESGGRRARPARADGTGHP